jgi:hypothetical protein
MQDTQKLQDDGARVVGYKGVQKEFCC